MSLDVCMDLSFQVQARLATVPNMLRSRRFCGQCEAEAGDLGRLLESNTCARHRLQARGLFSYIFPSYRASLGLRVARLPTSTLIDISTRIRGGLRWPVYYFV